MAKNTRHWKNNTLITTHAHVHARVCIRKKKNTEEERERIDTHLQSQVDARIFWVAECSGTWFSGLEKQCNIKSARWSSFPHNDKEWYISSSLSFLSFFPLPEYAMAQNNDVWVILLNNKMCRSEGASFVTVVHVSGTSLQFQNCFTFWDWSS